MDTRPLSSPSPAQDSDYPIDPAAPKPPDGSSLPPSGRSLEDGECSLDDGDGDKHDAPISAPFSPTMPVSQNMCMLEPIITDFSISPLKEPLLSSPANEAPDSLSTAEFFTQNYRTGLFMDDDRIGAWALSDDDDDDGVDIVDNQPIRYDKSRAADILDTRKGYVSTGVLHRRALGFLARPPFDTTIWNKNRTEDVMAPKTVRSGLIIGSGVKTESSSGKALGRDSLSSRFGHIVLSHLITKMVQTRQTEARVVTHSIFKPPPRVATNDKKRTNWFRDLAWPQIPIRRFARTIPHGVRGKDLLDNCLSNRIPLDRAAWLIKCVGINEIRAARRKLQMGSSGSGGSMLKRVFARGDQISSATSMASDAKWVEDWTVETERFVELSIVKVCSNGSNWTPVFNYGMDIACQLLALNLIDGDHLAAWIAEQFELTEASYPFWFLLIRLFWHHLTLTRLASSRLAVRVLAELSACRENDRPELDEWTVTNLKEILYRLASEQPLAMVMPLRWSGLYAVLQPMYHDRSSTTDWKKEHHLSELNRRNLMLYNPHPPMSKIICARAQVMGLLNAFSLSTLEGPFLGHIPDFSRLAVQCSTTDLPPHHRALTVIRWACTKHASSLWRVNLAVRLLSEWHNIDHAYSLSGSTPPTGWTLLDRILFAILMNPSICGFDNVDYTALSTIIGRLVRSGRFAIRTFNLYLTSMGIKSRPAVRLSGVRIEKNWTAALARQRFQQRMMQSAVTFDQPWKQSDRVPVLEEWTNSEDETMLRLYFQLPTYHMSRTTFSQWSANVGRWGYNKTAHNDQLARIQSEIDPFVGGDSFRALGLRRLYTFRPELQGMTVPDRFRLTDWIFDRLGLSNRVGFNSERMFRYSTRLPRRTVNESGSRSLIPFVLRMQPITFTALRFVFESFRDAESLAKLILGASVCPSENAESFHSALNDFVIDNFKSQTPLLPLLIAATRSHYLSFSAIGCLKNIVLQLVQMFHRIGKLAGEKSPPSLSLSHSRDLLSMCRAVTAEQKEARWLAIEQSTPSVLQAASFLRSHVCRSAGSQPHLSFNSIGLTGMSPVEGGAGVPEPADYGPDGISAKQAYDQMTGSAAQIFVYLNQQTLPPPEFRLTLVKYQQTIDKQMSFLKTVDEPIIRTVVIQWLHSCLRQESAAEPDHSIRYFLFIEFVLSTLIYTHTFRFEWLLDTLFPAPVLDDASPPDHSKALSSLPTPDSFRKDEGVPSRSDRQVFYLSQIAVSLGVSGKVWSNDRIQHYLQSFFPYQKLSDATSNFMDRLLAATRRLVDSFPDGQHLFPLLLADTVNLANRRAFCDFLNLSRARIGEKALIESRLGLTDESLAHNPFARRICLFLADPSGGLARCIQQSGHDNAGFFGRFTARLVAVCDEHNSASCRLLATFFLRGISSDLSLFLSIDKSATIQFGDSVNAASVRAGLSNACAKRALETFGGVAASKYSGPSAGESFRPKRSSTAVELDAFLDPSPEWVFDESASAEVGWTSLLSLDEGVQQRVCENATTQILVLFSVFERWMKRPDDGPMPEFPYVHLYAYSRLLDYSATSLPGEVSVQFLDAVIAKVGVLARWIPKPAGNLANLRDLRAVLDQIVANSPRDALYKTDSGDQPDPARLPRPEDYKDESSKSTGLAKPVVLQFSAWLHVFLHATSCHSLTSEKTPSCGGINLKSDVVALASLLSHPDLADPCFEGLLALIHDVLLLLSDRLVEEERLFLGSQMLRHGWHPVLSFAFPLRGSARLRCRHVMNLPKGAGEPEPKPSLKRPSSHLSFADRPAKRRVSSQLSRPAPDLECGEIPPEPSPTVRIVPVPPSSAADPSAPPVPIFFNPWEILTDTTVGKHTVVNDTSVSLALFEARRVRTEPPSALKRAPATSSNPYTSDSSSQSDSGEALSESSPLKSSSDDGDELYPPFPKDMSVLPPGPVSVFNTPWHQPDRPISLPTGFVYTTASKPKPAAPVRNPLVRSLARSEPRPGTRPRPRARPGPVLRPPPVSRPVTGASRRPTGVPMAHAPAGRQNSSSFGSGRPSLSNVRPSSSNVRPSSSNVRPSSSNVRPSSSNVGPSSSNVRPSSSNVGPSKLRYQSSSSRPRNNR